MLLSHVEWLNEFSDILLPRFELMEEFTEKFDNTSFLHDGWLGVFCSLSPDLSNIFSTLVLIQQIMERSASVRYGLQRPVTENVDKSVTTCHIRSTYISAPL